MALKGRPRTNGSQGERGRGKARVCNAIKKEKEKKVAPQPIIGVSSIFYRALAKEKSVREKVERKT